jgi:hypothetical protein
MREGVARQLLEPPQVLVPEMAYWVLVSFMGAALWSNLKQLKLLGLLSFVQVQPTQLLSELQRLAQFCQKRTLLRVS